MNTQHFRYAVEVERTGSISQAAENLFIGQPTLSKVIKEMEDTLGITIFRRTSRGTIATEKGAQFLQYAREVLSQVEKMEQLSRSDNQNSQRLSVTVPHADYILDAAADFLAAARGNAAIKVRVDEADAMTALENVQQEKSGLCVIRYTVAHEPYFSDYMTSAALEKELLWEFEPVLVAAKGSAPAVMARIGGDALRECAEITDGDNRVPYLTGEEGKGAKKQDAGIAVSMQAERLAMLRRIRDSYFYTSPVPAERLARYGLIQRRTPSGQKRWRDAIVWKSGRTLSQAEREFIDRLYTAKNKAAFEAVIED